MDLKKLSNLAKIHVEPEEEKRIAASLESILEYVSILNQVTTDGVEPLYNPNEENLPLREDRVVDFASDLIVAQAPETIGTGFKVPPIL